MSHPEYTDIGDPIDCLVEECSELIQALMKVKRFGWFNSHPEKQEHNVDRVLNEMHDVEVRMHQVKWLIASVADRHKAVE